MSLNCYSDGEKKPTVDQAFKDVLKSHVVSISIVEEGFTKIESNLALFS